MRKRDNRTSTKAWRPVRTPIQGIRAKLGNLECTVANLSHTGAMLRCRAEVPVVREVNLLLEFASGAVSTPVRVVRCDAD